MCVTTDKGELQEFSTCDLLSALGERLYGTVRSTFRSWCERATNLVHRAWWGRAVAPAPVVPAPAEPPAPSKNELCLKLEAISAELILPLNPSQLAPGAATPRQFAVLLNSSDGLVEKERKAAGVFSSFSTNKDLLTFLFGKQQAGAKIFALCWPHWFALSRIADYCDNKVFRCELESGEVYYVVSNQDYASKEVLLSHSEEQEQETLRQRLREREDLKMTVPRPLPSLSYPSQPCPPLPQLPPAPQVLSP